MLCKMSNRGTKNDNDENLMESLFGGELDGNGPRITMGLREGS